MEDIRESYSPVYVSRGNLDGDLVIILDLIATGFPDFNPPSIYL